MKTTIPELNALDLIKQIADGHRGLDLQFRRDKCDWPKCWKAALRANKHHTTHSKQAFGDSPEEALLRLAFELKGK